MLQSDMRKLEVFHNRCLRSICGIFWPKIISNQELYKKTNSKIMVQEIRYRRMSWLGHILRMDQQRIPKVALKWTPPGRRKPGRSKTTWRKTSISELSELNLFSVEAQRLARNRREWRQQILALCPTRDEEE